MTPSSYVPLEDWLFGLAYSKKRVQGHPVVVKVHEYAYGRALPLWSLIAVDSLAVNVVPPARAAFGTSFAVFEVALYVTVPETGVPFESVRVKFAAVTVEASIPAANVAVTLAPFATFVPASFGDVETTAGRAGSSSTIPGAGVLGTTPMSSSAFVVVCWTRTSGSPTPSAFSARPRIQRLVPVEKTSAPLVHVYFVAFAVADPVR